MSYRDIVKSTPRLLLGVMLLAIGIGIIIALVKYGSIIAYFAIYRLILAKITGNYPIDHNLANIIAILLAAFLWFIVYKMIYKRNKNWGYACIIGLMVFQSSCLFFIEKDMYFSFKTGEAMKYYTTSPLTSEILVFDQECYDAFGNQAQIITPDIAQALIRQKNSDQFPNEEVPFSKIQNFFDLRTGRALVYYSQNSNGYHFFMHDGYDPIAGQKLQPVTSEVINEYNKGHPYEASTLETTPPASTDQSQLNEYSPFPFTITPTMLWIFVIVVLIGMICLYLYVGTQPIPGQPVINTNSRQSKNTHSASNQDKNNSSTTYQGLKKTGHPIDTSIYNSESTRADLDKKLLNQGYWIDTRTYNSESTRAELDKLLMERGYEIDTSIYNSESTRAELDEELMNRKMKGQIKFKA